MGSCQKVSPGYIQACSMLEFKLGFFFLLKQTTCIMRGEGCNDITALPYSETLIYTDGMNYLSILPGIQISVFDDNVIKDDDDKVITATKA